ncbi:MAG: 2-oxo acid dehydrogenase subunit E2 [Anaerolineales bacterium]|nr:2-oxo acid dehydrogenase subunit E2 [Anaerolineales bacterium]
MAKDVIMPALGMAQETGTLIQWLKKSGDNVTKGEPLMEIETDKATVEIEAPASGTLSSITAQAGDVIPVGQRIALILAPGESESSATPHFDKLNAPLSTPQPVSTPSTSAKPQTFSATPVAARLAAEHNLDITKIKSNGGQVRKEDVLAYLDSQKPVSTSKILASPKAKRLAKENGIDLSTIKGTGPDGAILFSNIQSLISSSPIPNSQIATSKMWRVMADRLTQAWRTIPHFYLMREVNASRLVTWREKAQKNTTEKITYTDLLVKLTAVALRKYPRLNASWINENIVLNQDINIGLAVAVDDGLLVPVIHHADEMNLTQLASSRSGIVSRAKSNKLTLDDLSGGTFTISNLGMYGVDAFNAIVNPPQAAILAVSRIADRVVPVNGQPAVQPMMTLSLSCDHRVVDGARGAEFLQALADLIEEPLQLLN